MALVHRKKKTKINVLIYIVYIDFNNIKCKGYNIPHCAKNGIIKIKV